MANPTGWKPTWRRTRMRRRPTDVGAGGATRGIVHEEQLLFERGSAGPQRRVAAPLDVPAADRGRAPGASSLRGELAACRR